MTAAIALNRFGLGARPDEPTPHDPKAWLLDQFARYQPRPAAWAALPTANAIAADLVEGQQQVRSAEDDARAMARKLLGQQSRDTYQLAVNARAAAALASDTPFAERLMHFWSNHFAVSADKLVVIPFAGAFEAEAIRPHVLGKFVDMLLAVERHVGMQLYLDQAQSIGPNSMLASVAAQRNPQRKAGLNENLAREIIELHTLGVRTGYTQEDVTEFARALTGWSTGGLGRAAQRFGGEPGSFVFRQAMHEPGARTVIGKRYDQPGEQQGRAILHDLASAPATADHIAAKLARHFVSDRPPPVLVQRLSAAFRSSGGDLPTVYRVLIEAPEAWAPQPAKFKTPWDWMISAMRGIGLHELGQMQVAPLMQQLGQPVWRPGSPAGFDDIAASWAAPDALVRRVEVAQRMATVVGDRLDPRTLASKLLPDTVSAGTSEAIARAESLPTGLSLLLVSPEFQRR